MRRIYYSPSHMSVKLSSWRYSTVPRSIDQRLIHPIHTARGAWSVKAVAVHEKSPEMPITSVQSPHGVVKFAYAANIVWVGCLQASHVCSECKLPFMPCMRVMRLWASYD